MHYHGDKLNIIIYMQIIYILQQQFTQISCQKYHIIFKNYLTNVHIIGLDLIDLDITLLSTHYIDYIAIANFKDRRNQFIRVGQVSLL